MNRTERGGGGSGKKTWILLLHDLIIIPLSGVLRNPGKVIVDLSFHIHHLTQVI